MNHINGLFFQLIRVAIGAQETLSRLPSEAEWKLLFEMAEKQSLVGICFSGLQKLGADAVEGFLQIGMSEDLYLAWMSMAAQINMRNDVVNEQCVALQKRLAAEGIRSSILKGQAVAMLYGEDLRGFRQSGDIDIYVDRGREKAIEYARSIQGDVDWDYKHLHLNMFDTSVDPATSTAVEIHYVPEVLLNLRKNRKLQKWFKEHLEEMFMSTNFLNSSNISTPSVEFNLFYILLHTYRHFLYEGVGMRQLMDYYFVLHASYDNSKSDSNANLVALLKEFGMSRFASGVMWIMKEVFGMPEQLLLVEPDEKEGRYILSEVMTGGNFGKHKENRAYSKRKLGTFVRVVKHNSHMLCHYPENVLWTPIYFIWHKCWKLINNL